jgi:hypothetical protein
VIFPEGVEDEYVKLPFIFGLSSISYPLILGLTTHTPFFKEYPLSQYKQVGTILASNEH